MSKKEFNPQEWLQHSSTDAQPCVSYSNTTENAKTSQQTDVEEIITRIEANQIDITNAYSDWRDIGFAFATEFGQQGREYFHRISRFYPDYSTFECDKQFDKCLKSNGTGITLKTFFHTAKSAGVNIALKPLHKTEEERLPYFPAAVYENLPINLLS